MPSRGSRSSFWVFAIGLVASTPALAVGFAFDDLIHRLRLRDGRVQPVAPPAPQQSLTWPHERGPTGL